MCCPEAACGAIQAAKFPGTAIAPNIMPFFDTREASIATEMVFAWKKYRLVAK